LKVFVTGSSGFIGRALTLRLLQEGHNVVLALRSPLGQIPGTDFEKHQSQITLKKLDLASPHGWIEALDGVDQVFHLGGLIAYKKSQYQSMVLANVMGTSHVVEAAVAAGVKNLIHMSSVVAVGASPDGSEALDEESPYTLTPLGLGYFETKRKAEQIALAANGRNGLRVISVNPSTVYGSGDATKGSRSVQIKVAQGRFPFFPPGGANVIHVNDVVDATLAARTQGRAGERYILSGENLTLREIFSMIAAEAGVEPPHYPMPKFALRILSAVGDLLERHDYPFPITSETYHTSTLFHWFKNDKARKELGLNPQPAQVAVHDSVAWMKKNGIL
jgi:dihydroflavonol-4-reductase